MYVTGDITPEYLAHVAGERDEARGQQESEDDEPRQRELTE